MICTVACGRPCARYIGCRRAIFLFANVWHRPLWSTQTGRAVARSARWKNCLHITIGFP